MKRWMLFGLMVSAPALGQEELCEPFTLQDWQEHLDTADAIVETPNGATLKEARYRTEIIYKNARCSDALIPPELLVRFARTKALLALFDQDEIELGRWGLAMKSAASGELEWPEAMGETHPLVMAMADLPLPALLDARQEGALAHPKGGGIFGNGHFLAEAKALEEVPLLVQVVDKKEVVLRTVWQDGVMFPDDLFDAQGSGPAEPPKWYQPGAASALLLAAAESEPREGPAAPRESTCEPMSLSALEGLASESRDAVFADDFGRYAAASSAIRQRAACLTEPATYQVWAPHLITLAIAAYTTNGDWQGPLEAALRADPSVDRAVGPNHRIRTWSPPPESGADQVAVDRSIELYLDGQRVRYLPPLYGPHLVQVRRDGKLQSTFLMDQPVPKAWIAAPEGADSGSSVATTSGSTTSAVTQKSKKKRRTAAALITGAVAAGTFGGSIASRVAYDSNPSDGAFYATNGLYVGSVTLGVTSAVLMIRALATKKESPAQAQGIDIRQWALRYPQTPARNTVQK